MLIGSNIAGVFSFLFAKALNWSILTTLYGNRYSSTMKKKKKGLTRLCFFFFSLVDCKLCPQTSVLSVILFLFIHCLPLPKPLLNCWRNPSYMFFLHKDGSPKIPKVPGITGYQAARRTMYLCKFVRQFVDRNKQTHTGIPSSLVVKENLFCSVML